MRTFLDLLRAAWLTMLAALVGIATKTRAAWLVARVQRTINP